MLDTYPQTVPALAGHAPVVQFGQTGKHQLPHRLTIEKSHTGRRHEMFKVYFRGAVLLTTHQPIYDGSRALQALGFGGRVETWWIGKPGAAMLGSIEWCAKKATKETDANGLQLIDWHPFRKTPADTGG